MMSKRAFASPRQPRVLAHQRPSFNLPQRIAFGLLFSHGRMATHLSIEFRSNSTYSTSSNFFRQAALKPSLESLVQIANFLNVSSDDLLVDSLTHSASTADSEIHRLLLDCNTLEQEILTRMVKELKAILYGLGV